MAAIADVVDEVRRLCEPGSAVAGSVALHDDSLAEPFRYEANSIYAWPVNEERVPIAAGPLYEQQGRVRVVYAADNRGEQDLQQRDRTVSLVLDAKLEAYARAIGANQTRAPYWELARVAAVDHRFVRAFEVRGFSMDVLFRRQREEAS